MNKSISTPATKPPMGIDPFGKGLLFPGYPANPHHEKVFLGSFGIYMIVDTFDFDFYIRLPADGVMELLDEDPYGHTSLLARRPFDTSLPKLEQFKQMMLEVFIAVSHYQVPVCLSKAGLFKQRDWRNLETRMKVATRPKDSSEFSDDFGLLKMADSLGMDTRHEGGESKLFRGRCPAHHMHHVQLHPELGNWMCGYCRINGGVEDLKKFFEEHRS